MYVATFADYPAAIGAIGLAGLFSGIMLALEHWLPWQAWLGHPLKRIPSYIMGVAALYLPITVVLILWQLWIVLILIWVVCLTGGVVVCAGYFIDHYLQLRCSESILEEERELLNAEREQSCD